MTKNKTTKFQSYCWSIGNTSFRVKDLTLKNEQLLILLKKFNSEESSNWDEEDKIKFYELLQENSLARGEAPRPAKDAREKTSALVQLGLVTNERKLTEVGNYLLNIVEQKLFKDNCNELNLEADSYFYLCQLLKFTPSVENAALSGNLQKFYPLELVINTILELDYLTLDEFTYIVPLLAYEDTKKFNLSEDIRRLRNGAKTINQLLLDNVLSSPNFLQAKTAFLNSPTLTQKVFNNMIMSRKGDSYNKNYVTLYHRLEGIILKKQYSNLPNLIDLNKITNLKPLMAEFVFAPGLRAAERKNLLKANSLDALSLSVRSLQNERQLRNFFFEALHLSRVKSTLKDYSDLNLRYLSLTDVFQRKEDRIKLTEFPRLWFKLVRDQNEEKWLKRESSQQLQLVTDLSQLIPTCPDLKTIEDEVLRQYHIKITGGQELNFFVQKLYSNEFHTFILNKFPLETLLNLLNLFESYPETDATKSIAETVTDKALVPTIFEYIIAICWFYINEKKGDLLDAMNLSLDANFLPKTHAAGGQADIVFHYSASKEIPKHTLLIEATLADSTNQRRMEMEPVSRHLCNQLVDSMNPHDYAILVSTCIHPSVICDFRARKDNDMSMDGKNYVPSMKILPLSTAQIKELLKKHYTYPDTFSLLEKAYQSSDKPSQGWWQKNIVNRI